MKMNVEIYERRRKERRRHKLVVLRISNICVTDRPTDRSNNEQIWPLINAREAHMHLNMAGYTAGQSRTVVQEQ